MVWFIQLSLVWLLSAQGINAVFAMLSIGAAVGMCPKQVALASAVLYLALAHL
jgi:hypothetical protein